MPAKRKTTVNGRKSNSHALEKENGLASVSRHLPEARLSEVQAEIRRKRAILYARVSTDKQAEEGYSLPSQLDAMREYAQRKGFKVVAEFSDDCSGAIRLSDRPKGKLLVKILDRKEAEVVIVYATDRLARNLGHYLFLRDEWLEAGIELHYVTDGQSENTPESKLNDSIRGTFSEYWKAKILEGSMRGKIRKAENGLWVGGHGAPYGYRVEGKGKNAHLVIVPAHAEVVRRIYRDYVGARGKWASARQIARTLTAEGIPPPGGHGARGKPGRGWRQGTIRVILSREAYLGRFSFNGHAIQLPDLAIIDPATWEAAQAQRVERKRAATRNIKREYMLVNYLRCACGKRMTAYTSTPHRGRTVWYSYYMCNDKNSARHLATCTEKLLRVDIADSVAWEWLAGLLQDPMRLRAGLEQYARSLHTGQDKKRRELDRLNARIARLEKRIARLSQFASTAVDDDMAETYHAQANADAGVKAGFVAERDVLAAELAQADFGAEQQEEVMKAAAEIREGIADGDVSFEAKRQLVRWLNVQAKIEYRENVRGLYLECHLPYGADWRALPVVTRTY